MRRLIEGEAPVHGVLCLLDANWPLFGGNFTTRGVQALWSKKIYPQLQSEGPSPPRVSPSFIRRSRANCQHPEQAVRWCGGWRRSRAARRWLPGSFEDVIKQYNLGIDV